MKATVVGAGSFGTSLAKALADNKFDVNLWSHSKDTVNTIIDNKENKIYLPGVKLPDKITGHHDLREALKDTSLVLSVVPSQVTRQVWNEYKDAIPEGAAIVSGSKGIEKGTHLLVSEIFVDVLGEDKKDRLFFLSGPSFAKELANEIPTAITIAGYNSEKIPDIQKMFHTPYFRAYGTADVVGVELGGALKNVMAIATGISDGIGMGNNTRAAIITRGLHEIAKLGKQMGAHPITFMGLAGMGDLVLTCTGDLSRNRTVGLRLGEGMSLKEILDNMRMVAEGVPTTQSAYELSKKMNIEMPITESVYQMLYEDMSPRDVLLKVMGRKLKFENDF